jgi:TctA family transporter
MIDAAIQGLVAITQPWPLFLMLTGILGSTFIAAMPGVGVLLLLTIVLPYSMTLDPIPCIALLLGIGAVSNTANTFPSVLISVPGSAGSQATIVDGYPMAQNGEARRAFGAAFMASALGGIFGAMVLFASLPILTPLVLSFASPEFLVLVIWGLSAVGVLSGNAPIKGLLAAIMGVLISTVGVDDKSGVERFDFGGMYLWDGVNIVLVGLGLFAVPEMIALAVRRTAIAGNDLGHGVLQGIQDTLRHWWLVIRCSTIGVGVGVLPGLGSTVADWFAYSHAAQTEKDPERFGKGDVRGVIAPESSNNAKEGGALIPTIAFGIPGSTSLAIMLAAFVSVGITPGSEMLSSQLSYTMAMIWVLVIANLVATTLALAFSNVFANVSLLPFYLVIPVTLVLCVASSFSASFQLWDLLLFLIFSALGYFMKLFGWPRPPLLVAVVLGSQLERYLWLSQTRYGITWLWDPGVLAIMGLIFVTMGIPFLRRRAQGKRPGSATGSGDIGINHSSMLRLGNIVFTLFIIIALLLAAFVAMEWPLRSAMIVYWLAGLGGALALLQMFFDLRSVPWLGLRAGGKIPIADGTRMIAIRTAVIALWILGLVASVVLIGFHVALPGFVIAYVRFYKGSWTAALVLAALVEGFLVLAFDWLIAVLWPTPLLVLPFT